MGQRAVRASTGNNFFHEASCMVAQVPAGTFLFSQANTDGNGDGEGAPSGGLCTIVPNHLPTAGEAKTVHVLRGYCFYVEVTIAEVE